MKSKNTNFINVKRHILINNIYINKIEVFNKVSFCKKDFKCFTGYKNAKKIRLLCIFPPKISAYRRHFDET